MPKGNVVVPDGFQRGLFGIDLVLNANKWEEGILDLSFHPRLVVTTTVDIPLGRTMKMMDLLANQFDSDGKALEQEAFGVEMEKALADMPEKAHTLRKGSELNVFGLVGMFRGEKYVSGAPGSIENPIVTATPTILNQYLSLFFAKDCYIDWVVINGADHLINDITLDQLAHRFYNERTQGASERRVIMPH